MLNKEGKNFGRNSAVDSVVSKNFCHAQILTSISIQSLSIRSIAFQVNPITRHKFL